MSFDILTYLSVRKVFGNLKVFSQRERIGSQSLYQGFQ